MNEMLGLVIEEELRTGKKSPFWDITLRTLEGKMHARFWDVTNPDEDGVPRRGDFIRFDLDHKDVRDQREEKWGNVILKTHCVQKVAKEDIDQDVISELLAAPKAPTEKVEHYLRIMNDEQKVFYQNDKIRLFVRACLGQIPDTILASCPAAQQVHHAYQGGLVVHTGEVILLCRGVLSSFPWPKLVNEDLVYAGATLHDLGKTLTYHTNELGQPASKVEEYLFGHTYRSMTAVERIASKHDLEWSFTRELLHIIASHHSKPDWGAAAKPSTIESLIVAQADYLGSRIGIIESKMQFIKGGNGLLEEHWQDHEDRYIASAAMKKALE